MHIRTLLLRSLCFVLVGAWLTCGASAAFAQFSISRFTIDGGGGTRSIGGTFVLGGTIGQPDAGRLAGANFAVNGGFWFGGSAVSAVGDGPDDGGEQAPGALPLSFHLYLATPNPFSEQTRVAFDLSEPSLVRSAIYDASGRLVRILADQQLPAGTHQRTWDRRDQAGRRVPSGLYFLRLDAGAHRSHRRIVVIP